MKAVKFVFDDINGSEESLDNIYRTLAATPFYSLTILFFFMIQHLGIVFTFFVKFSVVI